MKLHLKPLILALALAGLTTPALAKEQTVTLSVPGMTCASCPFIVKAAISALDGVESVDTSLETKTAVVVFDDAVTNVDALTAATYSAGYESQPVGGDNS